MPIKTLRYYNKKRKKYVFLTKLGYSRLQEADKKNLTLAPKDVKKPDVLTQKTDGKHTKSSLKPMGRPDLDAIATGLGLTPGDYSNKSLLIDAIIEKQDGKEGST